MPPHAKRETTFDAPILSGGLSQQPAHLRLPTQVEDSQNAVHTVAEGASRRPGSRFERAPSGIGAGADVRLKAIDRGATERYQIVYGAGVLKVYEVVGATRLEATVNISADAAAYLADGSPAANELRFLPLADYTIIVNTKVAPVLINSDDFTIERVRDSYEAVVVYSTTVGNYVEAEEDSDTQIKGFWKYQPGTYTYAHQNYATLSTSWAIHDGFWNDPNYHASGFKIAFRRVALPGIALGTWDNTAKTFTSAGAFTSYHGNRRAGDMIYIDSVGTAGAGLVGWHRISSANANSVTLPDASAANGTANANVTDATYGETNICRIGIEAEVIIDVPTMSPQPRDMHDIAAEFTRVIRQQTGLQNACVAWVPQKAGGNWQITSPFRGDNAVVYDPSAPTPALVGSSGDLTALNAPFDNASIQRIAGSGGAAPDNEDTQAPEARWFRAPIPNQSGGQFDPMTMPVKMVRTSVSALPSTAAVFDVDTIDWNQRGSGDALSNPAPKLFETGTPISDACFGDGRLWFVGGPYVGSSQTDDLFNLFAEDAGNRIDSDPISRAVGGIGVPDIEFVVPHNRAMVLFTRAGEQFEVVADGAMTAESLLLEPSTRLQAVPAVRPIAFKSVLVIPASVTGGARLHEYVYAESAAANQTGDTTAHTPRLLPSDMRSIAASSNEDTLLALGQDDNVLYALRAFWNGLRKEQAAWSRWVFDPTYRVSDVNVLDGDAWLLVETAALIADVTVGSPTSLNLPSHGLSSGNTIKIIDSTTTPSINGSWTVTVTDPNNLTIPTATTSKGTATAYGYGRYCTNKWSLERLSLTSQELIDKWAYPVHLDRQMRLTGVHAAGTTTWTIPIAAVGSTLNKIVLGPAFGVSSGNVLDIGGYSGSTVTVAGNYSAGEAILGRFYDFSLELSRVFFKEGAIVADLRTDVLLRYVTVHHTTAGPYGVRVDYGDQRADITSSFTPTGHTQDFGEFKAWIMTKATRSAVFIESSHPTPLTIVSVQFTGELANGLR